MQSAESPETQREPEAQIPAQGAHSRESGLLRQYGFRHAFFTRQGGVSQGAYASLNFSVAVGDSAENVQANLGRAAQVLGVDPARVYYLSQVHGRDVRVLSGGESRESIIEARGDALVSRVPGLACGVRVADCVPILIGDRRTGAVAAVHAGWRGTVEGIVEAAVAELCASGSSAADLVAAIGPHISVAAFEVGEDVAERLAAVAPGLTAADVVNRAIGSKPHVDLRRIVRAQLHALGVPDAWIEDVAGCTASEPEVHFSFRRDGPRSGRHLAAIVAR